MSIDALRDPFEATLGSSYECFHENGSSRRMSPFLAGMITRRETLVLSGIAIASLFPGFPLSAFSTGEESPNLTWDLSPLYPSDAAWVAAADAIATRISSLDRWRTVAPLGDKGLAESLISFSDCQKDLARLSVYARLKAAADERLSANQARRLRAASLEAAFDTQMAWFAATIRSLGREPVLSYVAQHHEVTAFQFPLSRIFDEAAHALPTREEAALASAGTLLDGPQAIYNQIIGDVVVHPTIKLADDSTVLLDDPGYAQSRAASNRGDRKRVFDLFWRSYARQQNPFGTTLGMQASAANFNARLRGYDSALEAALEPAGIPKPVFRTMIAEARRAIPTYQRYLRLKQRALGLPDLHYYDLYAPLGASDRSFDLTTKRTLMLEAVAPLGRTYVDRLTAACEAGWVDMSQSPSRYAGAFTNLDAYDVHPYLLLNPAPDYHSLTEYVHEWGHAMHGALANSTQPYPTAHVETFVAEIASTHNEFLLSHLLRTKARSRQEKLFFIGQELEFIRINLFREPMLSEFELSVHEASASGRPLSGEEMTRTYLGLLTEYHGPAMVVDPAYAVEWTFIPQFYTSFYSFQYATSAAASSYFSEQVLAGNDAARTRYLEMLKAGGSAYGYQLVRSAGVDLASPEPYRALVTRFENLLDEAESQLV